MTPTIMNWAVPRSKEMALENLIMDWFFTKDYTTGPEAFVLTVGISEKDNPSFNRCIVNAKLHFKNDISTDAQRQIMLSLREFIRRNFDFSDNSSNQNAQHTVQPTIDDDKEDCEIKVVKIKSNDKTYDEVLSELDRHYQSIGGTCSYDENGHVCWNSKVGLCGSATMIPW